MLYEELLKKIRDAVRAAAAKVDGFKNGSIRVLMYPMVKEADDWLGGLGDFGRKTNPFAGISMGYNDIPDYEWCFSITPGGSRVAIWPKEGTDDEVVEQDTYAFSAMKIAYCSRVEDREKGLSSSVKLDEPYLSEENGFARYPGAICVIVKKEQPYALIPAVKEGIPWLYIYVSVSGAESEDDEKCASAAITVIEEFFGDGYNFETP